MRKLLKCALIGFGGYGGVHARELLVAQAAGRIRLVGAADADPERSAAVVAQLQALNCPIYSDGHALLESVGSGLDLCVIATPIHTHADLTVAALQSGANVLVEKPLAATLDEVRAIRLAESTTGRFVAVGFQHICAPQIRELQGRLQAGMLGRIHRIRASGLWARPHAYYNRNSWAGKLHANGRPVFDSPINNAFAHHLMLMLFLGATESGGAAQAVAVTAEIYRSQEIESFDTGAVRVMTSEGIEMLLLAGHACPRNLPPQIVIEGTTGRLKWTLRDQPLEEDCKVERFGGANEFIAMPDVMTLRANVLQSALDHVEDPSAPICRASIAQAHTAWVDLVHHSGEIVTLGEPFVVTESRPAGDKQSVIVGIEEDFERCLAAFCLPSELGLPWATAARDFPVTPDIFV